MAMKIPTFKAQTQLSGEVGNTNFSIQANPQAMSQGYTAQANLGGQVTQFGNQLFDMGTKLQEIKNTSEAQRIENEYKKITTHIQKRAELLGGETDVHAWVATERQKAKIALLNGGTYELESLNAQNGDKIIFNAKEDGSPHDLVKNRSVKNTANQQMTNVDILSDPTIQKLSAIQYTNNLTASFQQQEDLLITDLIENHDTAEGEIAYDKIFGPDGLIDQKRNANLYKSFADQYEDIQRVTNLISEGILNNMMVVLAQNEDPNTEEMLQNQVRNYADRLDQKGPDGSYKLFPNMTKTLRDELKLKAYDAVFENVKKNNEREKTAIALAKSKKQQAIQDQEDTFINDIINQGENFDDARLDSALSKKEIDRKSYEALKTFINNQEFGSITRSSRADTADFMTRLYDAQNNNELDDLAKEIRTDFTNKTMTNEEYLARMALIASRRQSGDTEYGRTVKILTEKLKAKLRPLSIDDEFGTNTTLAENSILGNFVVAIAPKDGVYPSKEQLNQSYNQAVTDYYRTQADVISDDYNSLPIMFGPDVIENYNALYEDDENLGDTASLFFPIIKANPNQFRIDMNLAFDGLPTEEQTETRRRSFKAKLDDVILMSRAYDPDIMKKFEIESEVKDIK